MSFSVERIVGTAHPTILAREQSREREPATTYSRAYRSPLPANALMSSDASGAPLVPSARDARSVREPRPSRSFVIRGPDVKVIEVTLGMKLIEELERSRLRSLEAEGRRDEEARGVVGVVCRDSSVSDGFRWSSNALPDNRRVRAGASQQSTPVPATTLVGDASPRH